METKLIITIHKEKLMFEFKMLDKYSTVLKAVPQSKVDVTVKFHNSVSMCSTVKSSMVITVALIE